jgi:hypothetical protein
LIERPLGANGGDAPGPAAAVCSPANGDELQPTDA